MSHEKRTCPCKSLPLSLSSFTAAEYGDLHTLSSRSRSTSVHRTDAGGYTPLYYAAQHGHVAATCLLLESGATPDGAVGSCGATPLHRASYAGAVATMRILLDPKYECDLLAKDTSFGDQMTPLHKAAAGGRYLAVQLLLDALRCASSRTIRDVSAATDEWRSVLYQALMSCDARNRTPLKVAVELARIQEQERSCVQRWDAVAGDSADWDRCVLLLRAAQEESAQISDIAANSQAPRIETMTGRQRETTKELEPLPPHLMAGAVSCLDCAAADDGSCLTGSWENAFRAVLMSSVNLSLNKPVSSSSAQAAGNDNHEIVSTGRISQGCFDGNEINSTTKCERTHRSQPQKEEKDESSFGRTCSRCNAMSFALFPKGGRLVCRGCAKVPPRRRFDASGRFTTHQI